MHLSWELWEIRPTPNSPALPGDANPPSPARATPFSTSTMSRLAPRELEKIRLSQAGSIAQKRLARGVRLNMPEASCLLTSVCLEMIRDGVSVAALMDKGRRMLGRRQVMDGVPEMLAEVQIEGTFPDGTKLVTLHDPVAALDGDLALALYGSFLPTPALSKFGTAPPAGGSNVPGAIVTLPGAAPIALNAGRRRVGLRVTNMSDRPIQVRWCRATPPLLPLLTQQPAPRAGGLALPLHRDQPAPAVRPGGRVRMPA